MVSLYEYRGSRAKKWCQACHVAPALPNLVLCQNFKALALKTAEQEARTAKMRVNFSELRELNMGQSVKGGLDQMETLENGPKGSLPIVY